MKRPEVAALAMLLALTSSPSAAGDEVRPLPTGGVYDSQLGGAYAPDPAVTIASRDREAPPASGLYSICYINGFQTQPQETEWWLERHPDLLLRSADTSLVEDENWPGEYLLDTSTPENRLAIAEIVGGWIDGCAAAGFDAIEPDNLDSWTRSNGLLSVENNLEQARLYADHAHAAGLAIAQKNALELGTTARAVAGFDFAIVEGCQVYDECEAYQAVYGDAMVEIEYSDTDRGYFEAACAARGSGIAVVLRDRNLAPAGEDEHIFEHC